MHLFIYALCKTIVPRNLAYCWSNLVNINLLIMPDFLFVKKGIIDFKIEFCKRYVVMAVWVKRRMNFRFYNQIWLNCKNQVYTRWQSPIMCAGFLIDCSNPNFEVTPSILEPSYVIMSLFCQRPVFTLKSPRTTVRKGLFTMTELRFNF